MHEETEIATPPGMFWIKLVGAIAAVAAMVFAVRIVWDALREKPGADGDEEAHLGI